jgi:hypothetical protein
MNHFVDILKLTLPSLIMLAAVYYIVNRFLQHSEKRRQLGIMKGNQKIITPLRLQAYERLILFLERITPDAMVMRASYPNNTVEQLHQELLQAIRAEFEHNLAQQLYVSVASWESVKHAKDYTIALINTAVKEVENEAPAIELSKQILSKTAEMELLPTQKAIIELKLDIQKIF